MKLTEYIDNGLGKDQREKKSSSSSYFQLVNSLKAFEEHRGMPIEVEALTDELVNEYDEWLQSKDYKQSTLCFFLRNLRTVCKQAVKDGIIPHLEFENMVLASTYETQYKTEYLTTQQLKTLKECDLKDARLIQARDVFFLCFYANGISEINLLRLKKEDYVCGRLSYKSMLNGSIYYIEVCQELAILIEKYKADDYSPYLLCFVDPEQGDYAERLARNRVKLAFQRLSKELGFSIQLGTAKASWVLQALELKIDTLTICEAIDCEFVTFLKYLKALGRSITTSQMVDFAHLLVARSV